MQMKMVEFDKYCKKCVYDRGMEDYEDYCFWCMNEPYTLNGVPTEFTSLEGEKND